MAAQAGQSTCSSHHGPTIEERLDEQSEVIRDMYEHLLEIPLPRIDEINEVSFYTLFQALGWLLEEIHVTWAHLRKKQTRLRLYTKSLEEYAYSAWRRRHILL
ncbi:hypothetical protein Tco_0390502 [Tanacetum coccineum]